jgi:dihydropteroate synthase
MLWTARQHQWTFPRPTLLMGIVNVTPDSFSDGGRFFSPDAAVERALELEAEGADLIDVGGESTRPDAQPVDEAEERRRVLPVIERLTARLRAPISIDTRKPAIARAAVAAGAAIVNDVGAGASGRAMAELVAESGVGYVCMHMQGTPETMQRAPAYQDVVAEVRAFLTRHLARLGAVGVREEQVVLDVGIGFGKTLAHNLTLLHSLRTFRTLDRPLLLGASRKSFISRLLGVGLEERLPASLACACWAVEQGVQILRVHDVATPRQAVRMIEALRDQTS